jgi:acetyl-CoA carboxylase carboxyl transferase subunit alpha
VLEYGTYSVISPEGCASILWKDGTKADEAAARLRITSSDLLALRIVERIIDEPPGGAHQDVAAAAKLLDEALGEGLAELLTRTPEELVEDRYMRFRKLGAFNA